VASKEATASTNWFDVSRAFWDDVRVEWRKIAWPSQNETILGTVSVLVVVTIISIALGLVDFALSKIMSQVLP